MREDREKGGGNKEFNGYRDLHVFQLSYQLAKDIFEKTKTFPAEEKYSLIDQIRRSSRSVPANIAEAWKKRRYKKMFVSKMVDSAGEAGETEVWLDFSRDFGYLSDQDYKDLFSGYDRLNAMLYAVVDKADKFCPKEVR